MVENAFGILANRFRLLLTTFATTPPTTTKVVKACLCLHNLMQAQYPNLQNADLDGEDEERGIVPGAWRDVGFLADMDKARPAPQETHEGKMQRVYLKHYYHSPVGSVPWQDLAFQRN